MAIASYRLRTRGLSEILDRVVQRRGSHSSRLLVVTSLITSLFGCQTPLPPPPAAPIPAVPYIPFADGQNYVVIEPITYAIENTGVTLTVPAGFVTDWASTPRAIWSLLPPFGTYTKAAVVHDYLYWIQSCTRRQSDRLLLIAMSESNVSPTDQRIIYDGVRLGGQSAWDKDAREKRAGLTRFVSPDKSGRFVLSPTETWAQYRATHGQTPFDHTLPGVPPYCAVADQIRISYAH